MKIWQSLLVMLSVAVMLGFSSQLYANDGFGCAWCNVDDPVCQGDNCNDGEGNDGNTGDSGSDSSGGDGTGSTVDSDTQVTKSDDDTDWAEIGLGVASVALILYVADQDDDPAQSFREFSRGEKGRIVPQFNMTPDGHSYGLQYEMRF